MIQRNIMTRLIPCFLALPLALAAASSQAGDIGINFHFGPPPPAPVIIAPRPLYQPAGPAFYFSTTPEFIYSNSLGFYIAIGSPYDLFRYNNFYYIFHQGYWHRSPRIHGPWHVVERRALPPHFRRHKIDDIRRYRDRDYKRYKDNRRDHHDRRYHPSRDRDHRDHWDGRDGRDHRKDEQRR